MSDNGWDGTRPTVEEYTTASRRLIEYVLKTGSGQGLRDVKTCMDYTSALAALGTEEADESQASTN